MSSSRSVMATCRNGTPPISQHLFEPSTPERARARSRQLKPDEVTGGTFSITNFGSFGSVFATPVINQPQVAILGVGAIEKTPVVIDDAIAIRSIAFIALTFDHRLIDGALADQFVQKIKEVLENWTDSIL